MPATEPTVVAWPDGKLAKCGPSVKGSKPKAPCSLKNSGRARPINRFMMLTVTPGMPTEISYECRKARPVVEDQQLTTAAAAPVSQVDGKKYEHSRKKIPAAEPDCRGD